MYAIKIITSLSLKNNDDRTCERQTVKNDSVQSLPVPGYKKNTSSNASIGSHCSKLTRLLKYKAPSFSCTKNHPNNWYHTAFRN